MPDHPGREIVVLEPGRCGGSSAVLVNAVETGPSVVRSLAAHQILHRKVPDINVFRADADATGWTATAWKSAGEHTAVR